MLRLPSLRGDRLLKSLANNLLTHRKTAIGLSLLLSIGWILSGCSVSPSQYRMQGDKLILKEFDLIKNEGEDFHKIYNFVLGHEIAHAISFENEEFADPDGYEKIDF